MKNIEAGTSDRYHRSNKRNYIIFGHYEKPSTETLFDTIGNKDSDKQQLTVRPVGGLWYEQAPSDSKIIIPDSGLKKNNESVTKHEEMVESKPKYGLLKTSTVVFKTWFDNEENKILKLLMVILIGIVITMFWYFHTTVRELRQQSQNGSNTKIPRSTDSNGSYGVESLVDGESLDNKLKSSSVSVVIVDECCVIYFINGMISNLRLIDNFQMILKRTNNNHKVNFQT